MSRKTRRSRRGRLLVLVTLLVAAGAFVLWTRSGDTAPAAAGTPTAPTWVTPPSETAPPTAAPSADAGETAAEEAGEDEAGGDQAGEDQAETPPSSTAAPQDDEEEAGGELAAVAVSLTYTGYDASAGAVVAGGYAAGVVEVDATCTLVLRRDGVELRGESLGTPSATSTDCGEVRVGGDALASGTWEAVLSYTSETSTGESAPGEVVVP